MNTTFLYELNTNSYRTFVYNIDGPQKKFIFRFDLSLNKGRDSRIYFQGEDKRWILMMEDNYYERADNMPSKLQQEKIMAGELTKEIAQQQNSQLREERRREKMTFYFSCLEKLM